MATVTKTKEQETKRPSASSGVKLRDPAKDKETLCRNVTIYGKCRYEDKGCAFSHDVTRPIAIQNHEPSMKKTFNVDSPSFTPTFLTPNDPSTTKKPTGISPKAAAAAPFLPKSIISRTSAATPPLRHDAATPDWAMAQAQEFVPQQHHEMSHPPLSGENGYAQGSYDSFHVQQQVQQNPYVDGALSGPTFFPGSGGFQQPVQYHQYAPIGPSPSGLLPYQRTVHDLFISNDFREELQKKSAATLQTLPNSQLPSHIENYHSLVPLDTTHQKGSTILGGFTSWIYKVQSSNNGHFFALRRLEGYRLTSELAIRPAQSWKSLTNASVVKIHDAFTNRSFGDSSLIFVTDYHPLSKTLAEHHHLGQARNPRARNPEQVSEAVLWSYITQIASALKTIHSSGLAARILDPTKILLTGRNRIRLNGCGVMDVVQHDHQVPLVQLQRQDLANFGVLVLSIGAHVPDASKNFAAAMDQFKRYYKPDLQTAVVWLYSAMKNQEKSIDQFISLVSSQMMTAFNGSLHLDDSLYGEFSREVENGRLFRLMAKLNFINERPEYEHDRQWSENGERYFLKLFRDYIFHQVDAQNHPVTDLGHVLTCLNKLDAGIDERLTLVSRDEQNCFVVSYRDLKKGVEASFQELLKAGRRMH